VPIARDTNDWMLVRRAYSLNAGEPVIQEISTPTPANATIVPAGLEGGTPPTLAANMPPPKPGMDYSLLGDSTGPGIATSSASIAPAIAATSTAKPSLVAAVSAAAVPPVSATPIIAATLPAPLATPAAPASRFEVASSPDNFPAPALAAASIRPAAPPPAPKRKARTVVAAATPSAAALASESAAAMPAKRGAWRINIGSFDVPAQAQALYARVQAAGLSVRLAEKQLDGRTWTRVQVGSYPTTAAAQAAAPSVRRQLRLGPVWFAQDK
jgi:cell division septation protein DedD